MTNTFPIFEVPTIPPDLRQEESLMQIADCLDYLSEASNTIFDCINSRIKENKEKINYLEKRIAAAKTKIEKLKGIKKATHIFSSAKYPASDIFKDYISVFEGVSKVVFTPADIRISEKYVFPKNEFLVEEKLQFFHVKKTRAHSDKNFKLNEGLGDLPNDIDSMSSLLLFNTSENPYERYVTLDPMGVINKLRKHNSEDNFHQMEAAPISISKQNELEELVKENYFYSPCLGDVPKIDAPLDLPDLPGIADDLKYSLDLGPGFAPSVTSTPAAPDLPIIPEDSFKDVKSDKNGETQLITVQPVLSPPLPSPPPPPPPPLPPPLPPLHLPLPLSPELISSSHLPPLPPPLPQPETEPQFEKKTLSEPAVIYATSNDARANLMAAIRNAGGKAKLRPIQSGRDETKRIKDEKNLASAGGDLMADLHNKLLLRRKGISGKKEGSPGDTVMAKISAMIPPPVHHEMSSATEDDDWEE